MYVLKRQSTAYQAIATLVAVSLVLWGLGVHMFSHKAEAASLSYVKNTLSDSAPSEASDHEFEFRSPTDIAATNVIDITFPSQFTGTSSIAVADVDFEINGTDETLVAGAPGAAEWGFTWTGDVFRLTAGASESMASTATATIKIGTNADGGTNQITNPSATTSYEFLIETGPAGSPNDTGRTRVAIIENVLVTAQINTTLDFSITAVGNGATVNGTTTTGTTTNVTVPFGALSADVIETLAHDLSVTTNAANGYVVTVYSDGPLDSATAADIDDFDDGVPLNTPTTWSSPADLISDENTWGHWGISSEDGTTTRQAADEFDSGEWIAASTTPVVIMSHDDPSDGTTQGVGLARVGYQVEVTPLQEAGDDYSTTLTYIATPTF